MKKDKYVSENTQSQQHYSQKSLDTIKQEMLDGEQYDRDDVKKFLAFQKQLHDNGVECKVVE